MGGCYSTLDKAEAIADAEANWTEEQPCQCLRQYSFTTSLTWETVPITIYTCCCCNEREVARETVQAIIKCDSCGHQFRRTYEMRYHEKRKHKRWGHYGKGIEVKAHSAYRFSFAHLEQCFALIEQHILSSLGPGKVDIEPNKNWANDFYQLVTAGEPNRANANANQNVMY